MAIITRDEDNDKILFLHPVRKKDGTVQMRKLKSFKNLSSLSRNLDPDSWSKLTSKLDERDACERLRGPQDAQQEDQATSQTLV